MDTQDITWGEIRPDWPFIEQQRNKDLCAWGKEYGIDGLVFTLRFLIQFMLPDGNALVSVKPSILYPLN